jgi:hypothetical protein
MLRVLSRRSRGWRQLPSRLPVGSRCLVRGWRGWAGAGLARACWAADNWGWQAALPLGRPAPAGSQRFAAAQARRGQLPVLPAAAAAGRGGGCTAAWRCRGPGGLWKGCRGKSAAAVVCRPPEQSAEEAGAAAGCWMPGRQRGGRRRGHVCGSRGGRLLLVASGAARQGLGSVLDGGAKRTEAGEPKWAGKCATRSCTAVGRRAGARPATRRASWKPLKT